jgi:hypothetical protein
MCCRLAEQRIRAEWGLARDRKRDVAVLPSITVPAPRRR